jgi:hypothetical protein
VNRRLRVYAQESGGTIHFVDCQRCFLEPNSGHLVPALMRDALHPTAKGMLAWFGVLAPAVAKCVADGPVVLQAAQLQSKL